MDISVIVPIYNVEIYIEKCLVSLFTQTKTEGVQFILVNDCTPDGSMDVARSVIERFPDICVVIVDKELNEGLTSARQSGLNVALGEYVLHFDSDDWCESTMLEDLYSLAKENESDIVTCDYYKDYSNRITYKRSPSVNDSDECVNRTLYGILASALCVKLVKRSLYFQPNVKFFLKDISLAEDTFTSIMLLYFAKEIQYLPKAYLHYVQHGASITKNVTDKQRFDVVKVINEIECFYKERGDLDKINLALACRKMVLKVDFISYSDDVKKYIGIFPEVKDYIFSRKLKLPFRKRLILFSADREYLFLLKLLIKFKFFFRSLKTLT